MVLLGIFTCPHQIAESFVRRIGNPDRSQIAAAVATGKLCGVAPVGLHSIARFGRYQRWRHDLAVHAQFGQLPIQYVPGWSRFVTGSQITDRPQLLYQFPDRLQSIRNDAQWTDFSVWFGGGDNDCVRMDIQSEKA